MTDLKHSDSKQTFSTGAQRDTQKGKPRPDLISPVFLDRLGVLLAMGAEHYGERNWEQGIPLSRVLASAMRHLNATLDGLEDEDHPIQCVFNLMAYVHILHRIRNGSLPGELDDLPHEKNLESNLTSTKKKSTIDVTYFTANCCGILYRTHKGDPYIVGLCPVCSGRLKYV